MNRSLIITGALAGGFLLYIAANGHLSQYVQLFEPSAAPPAEPTGAGGTSALSTGTAAAGTINYASGNFVNPSTDFGSGADLGISTPSEYALNDVGDL